ncbi:MAG: penicillin-binding transpeptidase domain-containing protein, partial [Burkholderiaceae bacterium]
YKVDPYLISHITDSEGNLVAVAAPKLAGDENNRAIDARNAYIIDSMLRDVARRGTAAEARKLGREDVAGKTGTTNDSHDAWFVGYQPSIAATAWVGYDTPRELGVVETGGKVALPIWMTYMRGALKGVPLARQKPPAGLLQIQGDLYLSEATPESGIQTLGMSEGGITTGTRGKRAAENLRNEVF